MPAPAPAPAATATAGAEEASEATGTTEAAAGAAAPAETRAAGPSASAVRAGGKRKRGEEDTGREASGSRIEDGGSGADEDWDEGGEGDSVRRRTAARAAEGADSGVRGRNTRGRKRERDGGAKPGGTKKAKTGDG